ncbi:hypothetical protein [Natronosalvus rutilus]|uniref:Uncharacterized protein n=1 Tax=Natronosalvus rutilus TaxID=2953753 RepID=A0A9E7N8H1_9EURY|nr:hypothetical protein [Natronosalvus rutilus]UTF52278.1 hypothetical protein NGM29_10780 [Natronosalvus rutilus]
MNARSAAPLTVGVGGLVAVSANASAHELGHGGGFHTDATALIAVLSLATLAGFAGGVAIVRYGRRQVSENPTRGSGIAVGLLLVGLGTASLLPTATVDLRLSVAGGTIGAAIALLVASRRVGSREGCGNHADLTLGAILTHRVLEGVVLGTLYSAGAAVGLFGAVAVAGHSVLETAAVGRLYATGLRRNRAVGAITVVQVGFVAGTAAGLGAADAVPVPVRTLALAVVGGALLVVGVSETERSLVADEPTLVGGGS